MYELFGYPRLAMVIIIRMLWTLEGGLVCDAWITKIRQRNGKSDRRSIAQAEFRGPQVIRIRGPPQRDTAAPFEVGCTQRRGFSWH